ncbi:hypothetical protein P3X46_014870 [Hevea brasiliensis]|uniref:Phosphatidic acid phosphatase type 2/haloperoxidase domain-containing protein n=1 Tax=Hevea brasiliensis TaxID=3981 RepID=A0ABQ9LU37_HEVBR|nr:uncharacterized protein LOC110670440 [Hevea brasiliensis]KAJ9171511.1 hypothetical protein P3X46_014870 [Hevea brasiliensis]
MDSLILKPSFNYFKPSFNYFFLNPPNPGAKSFYPKHLSFFKLTYFTKFKNSPICLSCRTPSNRQNPNSDCNSSVCSFNPLWVFVPIFQRVKGVASSQTKKWVSRLRAYSEESKKAMNCYSGNYLQNGAFGVALLSITSNAKVRISPFVATLAANPTFISGLLAWFVAQSIKVILNFFVERKWDLRILFASGGMPSSHSALCTALTTSVALCHGVADSLFPVCLGFSLIVMYDAIGVRRHAGMQAEVLNLIVEDLFQGHPISERKLKELLGHTPLQVFAGAVLGILVACYFCQGGLVVT